MTLTLLDGEAALFESALWIVPARDNVVKQSPNLYQRFAIDSFEKSTPLRIRVRENCPPNFIIVIQEPFKMRLNPGGAAVNGTFGRIGIFDQPAESIDLHDQTIDVERDLLQVMINEAEDVLDGQ